MLVFSPKQDGLAGRLQRVVTSIFPDESLEVCRTVDHLAQGLRRAAQTPRLAVLRIAEQRNLSEILSLGDLLNDLRIILILPDRDRETIAQGHRLRPRFLSYVDSDLSDIAAVLGKMKSALNQ